MISIIYSKNTSEIVQYLGQAKSTPPFVSSNVNSFQLIYQLLIYSSKIFSNLSNLYYYSFNIKVIVWFVSSPKDKKQTPSSPKIAGKYDHLRMDVKKKHSTTTSSNSLNRVMGFLFVAILVFSGLLYAGVFSPNTTPTEDNPNQNWNNFDASSQTKILLYSSPDCSCCENYVAYLQDNGFSVDFRRTPKLDELKDSLGIPADSRSCHTAKVGDYFVEGHIPLKGIQKMLSEKPNIDGISLPGMPAGSPGMPGQKAGSFEVLSINGGAVSGTFISI